MSEPSSRPQPPAVPYGAPEGAPLGYAPVVPPKPKKPLFARWWFWLIVVVVALVIIGAVAGRGGSGTTPSGDGQVSAPAEQDAQADPAEQAEPAAPAVPGVGEAASVDGLEIVVTSVQAGVPSVGSEYAKEEAQGAFTLVDVQVTNTGSSAQSVFSGAFTLSDAAAREFEPSTTASIYLQDAGFSYEEINPGNTASGTLAFDLPADAAPQTLTFTPGMFGGDSVQIALN